MIRQLLLVAAIALLVAAVVLHVVQVETSTTTETSVVDTFAIAAPGSTAPSSPAPTRTTTTKTTVVRSVAGDPLVVGLLGASLIAVLAALFFKRIAEIGFLGTYLKLTPAQKKAAARAVAKGARRRSTERIAVIPPVELRNARLIADMRSGVDRAVAMGRAERSFDISDVAEAQEVSSQQTADATLTVINDAETLLRLGAVSPADLRALADSWGISAEEWAPLLEGEVSPRLWDRLAERALERAEA